MAELEATNPETVYIIWQRTPDNVEEYDVLIDQYDADGSVSKEKRTNIWARNEDIVKDQQGNPTFDQDGNFILVPGAFFWSVSEFFKDDFDTLEEQGVFDGLAYTKPADIYKYIEYNDLILNK